MDDEISATEQVVMQAPKTRCGIAQQNKSKEAPASVIDEEEKIFPADFGGSEEESPSGRIKIGRSSSSLSELPPVCSSLKLFGPLPGNRAQTATVAFPLRQPTRDVDHKIRELILKLNICVLFDYADKDNHDILETAQFIAFLNMIELPSARLRLRKFSPEIESHVDGIDYETFHHFLMLVCTTDSHQSHDIDEASVAIANLLRSIRKNMRNDHARQLTQSKAQPVPPRRPEAPPVRIARVPTTISERKKNSNKRIQPASSIRNANNATGVHAFGHDVDDDRNDTCCRKCFKNVLAVVRDEFILVDRMHIPALLVLAWLVVGTTFYAWIQEWSVAQSFYFMVQAGFSVGFGALSEDYFISGKMPECVNITHNNSWHWLEQLKENDTFPLSDVPVLPGNRAPTWGLGQRYVEICPKWPWSPPRREASKILTVIFVIYGSIFYGWMFSLVGEKLVAKRTTWIEEQEANRQRRRAEVHRKAMQDIQPTGIAPALMQLVQTGKIGGEKDKVVARNWCQVVSEWCSSNWIWLLCLTWVVIGMLYATIFEQQSFGTAMEFAVTALSTGGLQAPLHTHRDPAMVAIGLYVLLGIPIYTFTVGKIAGWFMQGREKKESRLQLTKRAGTTKEFLQAVENLGELAGKEHKGTQLDFNRFMMWELMRIGKIEFDLLKDLRDRFDALDIDANGWIDLEEFNMVLTFNKFKTTDEQPGLYFHEFKNMVGTLLADDFVISKQDAYKTPAHPFVNEVWLEKMDLPEQQRLECISSELRRQFDAFCNGQDSEANSKESGSGDVRFFTTLDFFEWTNAHTVVKLQKPTSGEDPWANLTHQWKAHCEKNKITDDRSSNPTKTGADDTETERAKKEQFAMDLATFTVKYELEIKRPIQTFAKGDWVQILKESSKKGWIVRVVDPCVDGLVQVRSPSEEGWVRTYDPKDLRKLQQLMM